mgnify:CR=1 FL=1|jgi:hypothetical protein
MGKKDKSSNKSKSTSSKKESNTTVSKENRYSNVEKGDCPNKETAWAKLTFNVKTVRKYLKNYITQTHGPNISMINLHFACTVVIELFIQTLVEKAIKYSKKEPKKADLYNVTIDNVKRAVRDNSEMKMYLGSEAENFNPKSVNYVLAFMESKDSVMKFIDKKIGTSQVSFDPDAFNLIVYLTIFNLNRHVELANVMRQYAKKSSINYKGISYANMFLLAGDYQKKCQIKLDELETMLNGKKVDINSEEDDGNSEKADGNSEKADKNSDDNSDSDSDDDSDDNSDNDSDDDSDDDDSD